MRTHSRNSVGFGLVEDPWSLRPASRACADRARLRHGLAAATLFGVNGSVGEGGALIRPVVAAAVGGALRGRVRRAHALHAAHSPGSLRIRDRRELLRLAIFGAGGVCARAASSTSSRSTGSQSDCLLIQYLGPLLVAIWARTFGHEHVRRRIWSRSRSRLSGLAVMVELWQGIALDGSRHYALIAAVIFAAYLLLASGSRPRDPVSLMAWGFLFATLFWTVVQPCGASGPRVGRPVSLQASWRSCTCPVWRSALGGGARLDRPVLAHGRPGSAT